MAKTIATRRFGVITVDNEVLIKQPLTEDIKLRLWTLVEHPRMGRLQWLQSLQDPDQAVPVICSNELGIAPMKGKFYIAKEGIVEADMTVDTRKALILKDNTGSIISQQCGDIFKVCNFLQRSALAEWAAQF